MKNRSARANVQSDRGSLVDREENSRIFRSDVHVAGVRSSNSAVRGCRRPDVGFVSAVQGKRERWIAAAAGSGGVDLKEGKCSGLQNERIDRIDRTHPNVAAVRIVNIVAGHRPLGHRRRRNDTKHEKNREPHLAEIAHRTGH